MEKKFRNKYRIESTRLQIWDYKWCGQYFVTINIRGRACFFGEIIDGEMILSEMGKIAKSEWLKSPEIRPDMNIELDEYQVMPNHVHGIIRIGKNEYNESNGGNVSDCNGRDTMHFGDTMHGVSATNLSDPNEKSTNTGKNKFGPQIKNLSSIIRGFKSAVTTDARKIDPDFGWQSRFHDQIIRDERSLNNLRKYIQENPKNWKGDGLNTENNKGNKNYLKGNVS